MPPVFLARFSFAAPDWMAYTVAGGLVALLALGLAHSRSPLRGWPRGLALALKALGFALLCLCLLEPSWTDAQPQKAANDLLVLADNGARFRVKAPGATVSSGDRLAEALRGTKATAGPDAPGKLSPWLEQVSQDYRLQSYVVDGTARRTADFSELRHDGHASTMLTSLASLRDRFASRPVAAAVLFTDGNGADTGALETVLERLKEKPMPVFVVAAGLEDTEAPDVGVTGATAEVSPFEDAPVTLTVDLATRGLAGKSVTVLVRDEGGKELAREAAVVPPAPKDSRDGLSAQSLRLQVPTAAPGLSFYQVMAVESALADAAARPDALKSESREITLENNARLVAADRGQGPFRVLYVGGRPNWDYKFLRRSLGPDSDVKLVSLLRIARREPKFEWRGRAGESSNPLFRGFQSDIPEEAQRYDQPVLIRLGTETPEELRDGFPKAEAELFGAYRAIVLDDVEAEFFTQEQLNLLERFVSRRGGALLMMGGQECFRQGGWDRTPVGRLLPVYLDRIQAGPPPLAARYTLTREGFLEPWMRLHRDQGEEEKRLAFMPEFQAVNATAAIKPGASLLATVTDSQQRVLPALATQRFGEGRAAALMVADVWRWGMKDPERRADMEKAWRQLFRWLVVDTPDRVTLETQREPVPDAGGERMRFLVRARDEAWRGLDDATVKLTVTRPDQSTEDLATEASLEDPGLFEAAFQPREPGAYRVRAEVRDPDGALLAEKAAGWAVNTGAEEYRALSVNRPLLEALTQATGGRLLSPEEASTLPELLAQLDAPVMETRTRPLWHLPWIFLLALLCFLGEWTLRRWKGGTL